MSKKIVVERSGGKWELIGFLIIAFSVISIISSASSGAPGGADSAMHSVWFGAVGFIIFLVGRFK